MKVWPLIFALIFSSYACAGVCRGHARKLAIATTTGLSSLLGGGAYWWRTFPGPDPFTSDDPDLIPQSCHIQSLRYDRLLRKFWRSTCSAGLVDSNKIISAAHCLWKKGVEYRVICPGEPPRKLVNKYFPPGLFTAMKEAEFSGSEVVADGNAPGPFSPRTMPHDIAIGILESHSAIPPMELPDASLLYEFYNGHTRTCHIFGYGITEKGERGRHHHAEALPFLTQTEDSEPIFTANTRFPAFRSHDSGGPMVILRNTQPPLLLGIVVRKINDKNGLIVPVPHHAEWLRNFKKH